MNREERQQSLNYRHHLPSSSIVEEQSQQQQQQQKRKDTIPSSLQLVQSLYEKSLTPVIQHYTAPYSFNKVEEDLGNQGISTNHNRDKNTNSQVKHYRKHLANNRAIISQLVPSSNQHSFEHLIGKSRLLRPAFCDVTDIWQKNKTTQLSLAWFERQREVRHSQLSSKKIEKKEHHKKRKAIKQQLQHSLKKSSLIKQNPKLFLKNMTSITNNNNTTTSSQVTSAQNNSNHTAAAATAAATTTTTTKKTPHPKLVSEQKQIASEGFNKLHELWKQYIISLGSISPDQYLKIDLHGAKVTVVKSTNPSLVGKSGIIIQETCNTFQIWTPAQKSVTIPKKSSVFEIKMDETRTISIFGTHFMYRPAERATKKFTRNDSIDL